MTTEPETCFTAAEILGNLESMVENHISEEDIKRSLLAAAKRKDVSAVDYYHAAKSFPKFRDEIATMLDEAVCRLEPARPFVTLIDAAAPMLASYQSGVCYLEAAACFSAGLTSSQRRIFTVSDFFIEVANPGTALAFIDALIIAQPNGGAGMLKALEIVESQVPYEILTVYSLEEKISGLEAIFEVKNLYCHRKVKK